MFQNAQPAPPLPSLAEQQPNPPPPTTDEAANDITEEERNFDIQFKEWDEKFATWREENKNHPDKVNSKYQCLLCTSNVILFIFLLILRKRWRSMKLNGECGEIN